MNTSEIQKRIDAVNGIITAKGLKEAVASFEVEGHREYLAGARWYAGATGNEFRSFRATRGDEESVLSQLEAWADNLPSVEQRRLAEFTEQLAKTIEMGNAHGIDVQFVNPLTEAMKRLSENALTDQR